VEGAAGAAGTLALAAGVTLRGTAGALAGGSYSGLGVGFTGSLELAGRLLPRSKFSMQCSLRAPRGAWMTSSLFTRCVRLCNTSCGGHFASRKTYRA
jgi:hypothetical protein